MNNYSTITWVRRGFLVNPLDYSSTSREVYELGCTLLRQYWISTPYPLYEKYSATISYQGKYANRAAIGEESLGWAPEYQRPALHLISAAIGKNQYTERYVEGNPKFTRIHRVRFLL